YELSESVDELFERFKRGDQSRNTEGSGLGLAIAKSIIDLHDGELDIEVDGDLFKVIVTLETV
ncbi:ATP-binding protein, partial [Enterococcus faecium]|uniref:ATP-binding protein n=1 Tax=Enterococcus faecium TaxID=1352 RepID=UPI0030C7D06E